MIESTCLASPSRTDFTDSSFTFFHEEYSQAKPIESKISAYVSFSDGTDDDNQFVGVLLLSSTMLSLVTPVSTLISVRVVSSVSPTTVTFAAIFFT